MLLKIGDKVVPITKKGCGLDSTDFAYLTITGTQNGYLEYEAFDASGILLGACSSCYKESNLTLVNSSKFSPMNLIEKAKLAFKSEPEKSFIKAGVMDSNENLTAGGKELFLTYLLEKNKDDFKTTVVDPILAEEEAK